MYKLNSYFVVKVPDHPHSFSWGNNGTGWGYEHRLVVEKHIGRFLDSSEVVHHINFDRGDNRIENLGILSQEEHSRIHSILTGCKEIQCSCCFCNQTFTLLESVYLKRLERSKSGNIFCSDKCSKLHQRKLVRPSKETLEAEIGTVSWLALGRKYGVSDNAVRKWAKSYGIL